MRLSASPKLRLYSAIVCAGLIASLALSRPEPLLLTAPFFLALVAGLIVARQPVIGFAVTMDRDRALEGEDIDVEIGLEARSRVEHLELLLATPEGLFPTSGTPLVLTRLRAGERQSVCIRLHCAHWGGFYLGDLWMRARDPMGLLVYEVRIRGEQRLRVYPRQEALRRLPRALETQIFSGDEVSRTKGDGIEFADVRPFQPGDRVRRINWRLSTRRNELFVNEFHQERNTDLVIFLDAFDDFELDGQSTRLMAIRAAAGLVEQFLQRRDRVALVSFGGTLRWLTPATGAVQRYRMVEALIETDIVMSYAWKGIEIIPRRTLPPNALVLAITPLVDQRTIAALIDLRARRFDLAIVEVSPVPFVAPGRRPLDAQAYRFWLLERAGVRDRFRRLGVAVVEWRDGRPLQEALEEVSAFRRFARRSHAS